MISIDIDHPDSEPPRTITLTLVCDGDHYPDVVSAEFKRTHEDDFVEQRRHATAKGWLETYRDGERVHFCPACSGKEPKELSEVE